MTSEGRTKLLSRPRQRAREQLSPLYAREREAEHDRLRASDGAEAGSVALDSRRRVRAEDPGLPERHTAPRSFGQDVHGGLARLVDQGRLRHRVRRPGGHRHCREVTAVPGGVLLYEDPLGLEKRKRDEADDRRGSHEQWITDLPAEQNHEAPERNERGKP